MNRLLEENLDEIRLGMVVGFELSVLMFFSAGMVYYYRHELVPVFLSALVFVSWYLGFSGTLLLPADIADDVIQRGSSAWVLDCWLTIYWTTFVLAWVVLPIANAAWHEGELTWRRRLESAVRSNLKSYIVMGALGLAFIIYVLASGQAKLGSLSGFLMAWGNTYGLMLIVLLLGHGLVEVPRKLWQNSFADRELRLLYFRATAADMDLHDAMFDLEDAEIDVDRMETIIERDDDARDASPADREDLLRSFAAVRATRDAFLATESDRFGGGGMGAKKGSGGAAVTPVTNGSSRNVSRNGSPREWGSSERCEVARISSGSSRKARDLRATQRCLVRLNSRLRRSQERVAAARQKWETLLHRVDSVEVVATNTLPYPMVARNAGSGSVNGSPSNGGRGGGGSLIGSLCLLLWARATWHWRVYWGGWCQRALAVLCGGLSALIVWSEIVIGAQNVVNLSPFGALLRAMDGDAGVGAVHPLLLQATALVPFLYMSVCCYRSLFKLRLFGEYGLQGPHQSLPGPLLFNAQYLIRLQFPLGYNFLQMVGYGGRSGTAFQKLMSNMEVVPILGTSFTTYAPLVMVLLCAFTLCKGYAKTLRLVGLEHEDLASEDDPDGKERLEEGRKLIDRTRRANAVREKRRMDRSGSGGGSTASSAAASPANGYVAPSVGAAAYGRLRTSEPGVEVV